MASVFLSYDHEDSARAAPLAAALEAHGHSVWWDSHIHGGAEYNSAIENAVESADAVVVLWSANSVRSAWVRDEAAEGRDAGKLVPVLIEAVKPPMGFRQYQTIDLTGWTGGKRIARLPDLLNAIDKVAKTPPPANGPEPVVAPAATASTTAAANGRFSRRMLLGGGAAATAALATGGVWWASRERVDPRYQALIDQAQEALRHQSSDQQTVRTLEEAIAIRPRSAEPLGLLALVKCFLAQNSNLTGAAALISDAERMARRALALNPQEPNALLAMFELQGSTLDWFTRDQRLRQIIAIDPRNLTGISELVALTQATGMNRESWDWNERALAVEPLSSDLLGKRAMKLWILGRTSEADKVSDQLRGLYPADEWAWYVRFHIYAFSGRARAALAMLDDGASTRDWVSDSAFWHAALTALDQPSAEKRASARAASIAGATSAPQTAREAAMVMSALGELDLAFDFAAGLLMGRGAYVQREKHGSTLASQEAAWRIGTQWMFLPPSHAMRSDARFLPLCEGVGLTDYWRKRGVKPDYQRA